MYHNAIFILNECRKAGACSRVAMLAVALIASLLGFISAIGANRVEYSVSDSIVEPGVPKFISWGLSNCRGASVDIDFSIISSDPFTIYKAEWLNNDSLKQPLEPFNLIAKADTVTDKAIIWRVMLEFPYSQVFGDYDQLKIYTDKGVITSFTSPRGKYEAQMDELKKKHDEYIEKSEHHERNLVVMITAISGILIAAGIWMYFSVRRRMARQNMVIEDLSTMIEERSELNLELRNKVNALYRTRLDTLNMLCEGYFNNKESDKTKQLFYRDVENTILSLRDSKSLEKLEGIVNEYLDDTIAKVRRQIPDLSMSDLKFLTYIYAGFSPRAVCIFMDIKIKTFYNRRNLLKERILASDAPDREYFVSLMSA